MKKLLKWIYSFVLSCALCANAFAVNPVQSGVTLPILSEGGLFQTATINLDSIRRNSDGKWISYELDIQTHLTSNGAPPLKALVVADCVGRTRSEDRFQFNANAMVPVTPGTPSAVEVDAACKYAKSKTLAIREVNFQLNQSQTAAASVTAEQVKLGWKYLGGEGVAMDYAYAYRLFTLASEQGDLGGDRAIATMYSEGLGVVRDERKAFEMLTALNDKGHFDSASDLGRYYQDGRVASKDPEHAFSLFEYAAQNGSAAGQFNVGKAYRDGVGIARDEIKAAFWMSKAAIQGLDEAANALAKLPPQARESANIRLAASGLSVDTRDALVTTASTQTNEQTAMRVAAGRQREADRLLALMQKQLEEERQANALQKLRQEQEKEKQREQERLVEMRRNLDAEAKLAAAKKATEESLAEAQRRQEEKLEQERLAEIKRKQEEAQRLLAQQRKEDERRAAVQLQLDQQAEAQRIKEEQAQAISTARRFYANRKALVIGNDQYQFVNKLSNAVADAKAIGKSLEGLGYQVNLQTDLDEKRMKKALRVFREGIQGGDEVLFYYAGHGTQIGATNYLLPTDIQGENEAQVRDEAIQLQRILDDMSEQKAKFTLVVIDACRDNPFKVAGRAIGGRGLAPTSAATGQMVIFSAGTGQQALDNLGSHDKDPNGIFTRTFLKEIEKPGISVDRVLRNVRSQVIALARSVGREQTPALYDQADGDFYLNPPK